MRQYIYEITKWDRFFALYEDDELVAVCTYKRGAMAVRDRLEQLRKEIDHLRTFIEIQKGGTHGKGDQENESD